MSKVDTMYLVSETTAKAFFGDHIMAGLTRPSEAYGDKMELSGTINTVVVAPSPQEQPQIIDARARQLPEPEFEE